MRGKVAALLAPAFAALAIAGCAQSGPATETGTLPPNYAPYDPETNPYCGALGNCRPLITEPYRIQSNHP
jgi:hypothetical protein